MYKEYPAGTAPPAMEALAHKIRAADGFVFVIGEYNWGPQPGLKNLTDHFLEEWYWRPAAVVSYSPGRLSGARAGAAWHPILSEMGMIVISSTVAVGPIEETFDADGKPIGHVGSVVQKTFHRVADDLAWWTAAARNQRQLQAPPY
jgi:NAD(P)H-dependent FMN reductase